jgi:hypothetical protein
MNKRRLLKFRIVAAAVPVTASENCSFGHARRVVDADDDETFRSWVRPALISILDFRNEFFGPPLQFLCTLCSLVFPISF